ncbi:MAG: hypothetical protein ACI4F7_10590 [Acutalibacteraceae bacterium]
MLKNEPKKALSVIVDDGTQKIPVVNKFGKLICNIYIRPTDFSILDRYDKFVKDFNTIIAPLSGMDIDREGNAKFENDWEIIKSVEAEIKNRFNELFDMDEADEIFKTRSAFSSIGGEFFCTKVLMAIGNVIASAINTESEKALKKANKYITPPTEGDVDAGVFTESN